MTVVIIHVCVIRRKLKTPGTAEEHKRQEKPTINPIDRSRQLATYIWSGCPRQPTQLIDQAPSTIERVARETPNTNQHSSRACLQHSNNPP